MGRLTPEDVRGSLSLLIYFTDLRAAKFPIQGES